MGFALALRTPLPGGDDYLQLLVLQHVALDAQRLHEAPVIPIRVTVGQVVVRLGGRTTAPLTAGVRVEVQLVLLLTGVPQRRLETFCASPRNYNANQRVLKLKRLLAVIEVHCKRPRAADTD